MKRVSLLILLTFVLVNCKKDGSDPLPGLESIVGKWRPIEHTKAGGPKVAVTEGDIDLVEFRFDGVVLNKNGYQPCCPPTSYRINGVEFDIKPQIPVESDPICITVNCVSCSDLRITQVSRDEITMEYCGEYSTKFVRKQ